MNRQVRPNVIAVVQARGGSKGLPGKNVRKLGGHPLVAWAIACAFKAQSVGRVICSTDDPEIAQCALSYGAEVPFMRPTELASDTATDLDVFNHVLRELSLSDRPPDIFVQLRPTTPFRDPKWIDHGVHMLAQDPSITCFRTVAPVDHSPYKMWTLPPGQATLKPLISLPGIEEPFNMPRQALPTVYWHTGQVDIFPSSTIHGKSMTGNRIVPCIVPARGAIDIDSIDDFDFAELVRDKYMDLSTWQHLQKLNGDRVDDK